MDRREIRLLVYPCYRYLAECLAGVRRSMLFKESEGNTAVKRGFDGSPEKCLSPCDEEVEAEVTAYLENGNVFLCRQTIPCRHGYGKLSPAFPDYDIRRSCSGRRKSRI